MFNFERCENVSGTCLQGYVHAKYSELVHAFGRPDWISHRPDEKVTHEWMLEFTDAAGEQVRVTIYDWKFYDGGATVRTDEKIRWNIGGDSQRATWFVESAMRRGGNA